MPSLKKQPLPKDPREELVAQGNDLIRHVRFSLTTLEQNIIYFVMSKVKPDDKDFMRQTFTVAEFCETCGIHTSDRSGANYRTIKAALKSVADKSAWVEYPNGVEELVRWFDTYKIDHKSGKLTATLSQSIKPYLLGLIERAKEGGEGYTQTHLYKYLAMQSKYSKRLYEILKSYLYSSGGLEKIYRLTFLEYELDELKQLLNAFIYVRWQDFKCKALEPAVREINEVTDITVSYSVVKDGRKITGVNFSFQHKQMFERLEAETAAKKVLDTPRKSPTPKDTPPTDEPFAGQMTLDVGVKCTRCGTLNAGYVDGYFRCIDCEFGNYEPVEGEDDEDSSLEELPEKWQDCISHEQLILFAKVRGYKIGWAYMKAKDLKLPIISDKFKQEKIYSQ